MWRSYPEVVNVHLDVLTQTAAKLVAVAESKRGLSAEGMAEYVYPARRARELLKRFEDKRDLPSYRGLGELLDRYEQLVAQIDSGRATGTPPQREVVTSQLNAILRLAAQVRADAASGR